jgi:hypothetical protein
LIGVSYGGWARVTLHPGACSNTRCEPWYWVVLACYSGVSGLYCLWNWGVFRRLAVRSARDLKRRSHAMAKRASRAAAAMLVDTTGDGIADSVIVDTSGDGRPDTIVPLSETAHGR